MGERHAVSDADSRLWGGDRHDDHGGHRRHHPLREPEGVGELFRVDAWAGTERGEVARQGDHEGRAAGTALGVGGSSLAGSEGRSALEAAFRGTQEAHAPQPGDRDHCPSPAGGHVARADEARAIPSLLAGTDRLQIPDLVVGAGRGTARWHDPSAVRTLLPDAAGDRG